MNDLVMHLASLLFGLVYFFFFFNDTATTEIYTLSLHDALPISGPLFLAFVLGGPPSPARNLVLAWSAYYLLMVVVVFHTESRYRAPIAPFVLAGAAGGMAGLLQPERRRVFAAAGLLAGLALSLWLAWPYAVLGARALAAHRALAPLGPALDRGDLSE